VYHIDAGAQLELLAGEVRLGARAGARIVEGARCRLRTRDQVGNRLDAGICANDDHVGRIDELGHRREIFDRIVTEIFEQRRVDRDCGRTQEQRVAVRRRAGGDRHPDIARRATPVFDHHGLSQRFLERDRDDARNNVGRTTRSEWHDQRNHAVGIGGLGDG